MMFMHDDKMIIMIITAVTNLTAKTRAPIHSGLTKSPMSGKKHPIVRYRIKMYLHRLSC